MAKISLNVITAETLRELLRYEPETGNFTWRVRPANNMRAGDAAGCLSKRDGYRSIRLLGRYYLEHRLAWLYVNGEWPAEEIDHLNRVRSDNRIANLRLATKAENKQNTSLRRDSASGHKGISWHKRDQKWVAEIKLHGKKHYLGGFNNINDAIAARKSEESRLHPFAAASMHS